MLNNLKIGVRLGIGFAVTLALLIAIAVIGYTRIGALNLEIDSMANDRFPKTVQANNMIDAINNVARQLRNAYIFSGVEQQKALDAIPEQRKIITDNLDKLDKSVRSDAGKAILKKSAENRHKYVTQQDKFMEGLTANTREEIISLPAGDLRTAQAGYMVEM